MGFVFWGLVVCYAIIGVLVVIGLLLDPSWISPSPNGKYPAAWVIVSFLAILIIGAMWPLAIWLDSEWMAHESKGYEEA